MTDEINEIIRVLQLTTYDEDEWDADQLTAMKRACNALESKLQAAIDWLEVKSFIFSFFKWNLLNLIFVIRILMRVAEASVRNLFDRSSNWPKKWPNIRYPTIRKLCANSALN